MFVNETLVAGVWAAPYRVPPNVLYADRFSRLGSAARQARVGVWGACGGTDTPATGTSVPLGAPANGCDPNYAGGCVPSSSKDLDCKDIAARNFRVVGTDVHRLDGNHDGVACEG